LYSSRSALTRVIRPKRCPSKLGIPALPLLKTARPHSAAPACRRARPPRPPPSSRAPSREAGSPQPSAARSGSSGDSSVCLWPYVTVVRLHYSVPRVYERRSYEKETRLKEIEKIAALHPYPWCAAARGHSSRGAGLVFFKGAGCRWMAGGAPRPACTAHTARAARSAHRWYRRGGLVTLNIALREGGWWVVHVHSTRTRHTHTNATNVCKRHASARATHRHKQAFKTHLLRLG